MNKDRSLASVSFSLNASISRSGVVNAPMPNGADDNDRGWMEPTDSFIEFQGLGVAQPAGETGELMEER